jgi:hypothetical protein
VELSEEYIELLPSPSEREYVINADGVVACVLPPVVFCKGCNEFPILAFKPISKAAGTL